MLSSATSAVGPRNGASPFGAFEWSVSRRYMSATRKGAGVSLISIIAFAGIALSVATLIVVMSVFQGFRINILDQLLSVNGHVFVSNSVGPFTDYDKQAETLKAVPGVERAAPVLHVDAYAVGPSGQNAVRIQGMRKEDVISIEEVAGDGHLFSGSFENYGAGRKGGNEVALGIGLAAALGVSAGDVVTLATAGGVETAFGETKITQKDYRVGAIFSIGNSFYDQYYAYMPLEQAQLFKRKKGEVSEIEIRVSEPLKVDQYLDSIGQTAGIDYFLQDWRTRNSDIFNALQVERGLQRIILLMIVAVATLNIISGLVMLVKDKRGDIAILRTMGATQGSVMRIFLLVGATIGVTGAIAGVILGALIANNLGAIESFLSWAFGFRFFNPNIYYLSEIPSVFEWKEVSIVVLFALAMSFLSSAYPAWRASKLDPVEALRYE